MAIRVGLNSMIVEFDSHAVLELVNNKRSSRAKIYWVIYEIYALKMSFNEFKAQHIP